MRRTRLSPISEKTRARNAELSELTGDYLRRFPLCEARYFDGCQRYASEVHHVVPKSLAPELVLDERNFLAVCRLCHSTIEDDPASGDRGATMTLAQFREIFPC